MLKFFEKNAGISKVSLVLVLKSLSSKTTYACVLGYKFEVSSVLIVGFRQRRGGGIFMHPSLHLKTSP